MTLAIVVFCLFLGLFISQELLRRFPEFALVFFITAPLILEIYCLNSNTRIDFFNMIKIYSVVVALIFFSIFRITKIGETKSAKIVLYLIFLANIFEAVVKDFLGGGVGHYLNASAGLLLMFTAGEIDSVRITKDKFRDIKWDGLSLVWIIGYTIWNWVFVYLNYTVVSALHIAVLGVPLAVVFFDSKGRWLQTRALVLFSYLFIYYSLSSKINFNAYVFSNWKNEYVEYLLPIFSLIFMALYAIRFFWSAYLQRSIATETGKAKTI